MTKLYKNSISGSFGCICFCISERLPGFAEPTAVLTDKKIFCFIGEVHGADGAAVIPADTADVRSAAVTVWFSYDLFAKEAS